ncbi:MAG TPA: nuclear transport factor 2 family protein [Pyrinomonadaceae bacterium]
MNKNVVRGALVFAVLVLGLSGCQPAAAPDTNRSATATNTAAKETVDPKAVQEELVKMEKEWAAAAESHNVEAVRRIVADDAVIVYPDGVTATKGDEVRLIESGAITAESWELLEPKATLINPETAYLTGRSVIKNGKLKEANMKTAIDISGEYRFLNVYAKRDGRWQVVASQTTKIANPTPAASPAASRTP